MLLSSFCDTGVSFKIERLLEQHMMIASQTKIKSVIVSFVLHSLENLKKMN